MSGAARLLFIFCRSSRSAVLLLGFLVLAALPVAAEQEPEINITADRMEYFTDKEIVVFSGNALAVRGDTTLSADTMEATLGGGGGERSESSVQKLVATGNVNFRQSLPEPATDRFATGERGVYDAEKGLITLTFKMEEKTNEHRAGSRFIPFSKIEFRFTS